MRRCLLLHAKNKRKMMKRDIKEKENKGHEHPFSLSIHDSSKQVHRDLYDRLCLNPSSRTFSCDYCQIHCFPSQQHNFVSFGFFMINTDFQ